MADNPDFIPQQQNANQHSQRGQGMLERSIQRDGFLAPITVASDGEAIDGSLRLETSFTLFPNVEPLVIRSDGTRPVIHIREDIPNAKTDQAKRLSLSANRTAEVSLTWDSSVLNEWGADGLTDDFWLIGEVKPWEIEGGPLVEERDPMARSKDKEVECECPNCGHKFIWKTGNSFNKSQ